MSKKYHSIWDAIENTPAEAENMKLRGYPRSFCLRPSLC